MKKHKKKSKYAHLPRAVRRAIKDTVPLRYRRMYVKAMERHSRRFAIRVFCLQCVAWVRTEVTRCTSKACPLFQYRLLLSAAKAEKRVEADKVKQVRSAERKRIRKAKAVRRRAKLRNAKSSK